MTALITQYDSIVPSTIPSDAVAVAGYVGGSWPDYSILVALFPKARHKSVCVSADEDGDVLDIEHGDTEPTNTQAIVTWYKRQKARGLERPDLYADESDMPTVVAGMTASGIPESEYDQWMAWLGAAVLPAGVKARQYTFTALGRNLDASICDPAFWSSTPSPPAKNTISYAKFDAGTFVVNKLKLDERAVVERYDKLRATQTATKHPHRAQLAVLRLHLKWLAGRVSTVAHAQPRQNGKPSWNLDHRGYRFQQMIHRSQGQRFV